MRASKREPVLVTVQLPDHLAVADQTHVERIDAAPVNEWRSCARDRIEVPVDRIAEIEIVISEKIETPVMHAIRGDVRDVALRLQLELQQLKLQEGVT